MTAVDVDALDAARAAALREGLAQAIRDRINVRPVWTAERLADALLAGPLTPLLAEVRRGRALREAVEGLADDLGSYAVVRGIRVDPASVAADLRAVVAAVDGTP